MRYMIQSCLVVATLLGPRFASAAAITILPPSQTTIIGDLLSIELSISDLFDGAAPSLGVFDADLTFDSTIVSFVDVTWGNQLDLFGLGSLRAVTPGTGSVNLFELSLDSAADLNALQTANFLLATIFFQGTGLGTSQIALLVNALGDADGAPLSATMNPGLVTVTPVPEPATIILLMTGGAILFGSRRMSNGRLHGRGGVMTDGD